MATIAGSASPSKNNFLLPIPPPAQLRSGNTMDVPRSPGEPAFISPYATPQGSPSKKQPPPGAHDLPVQFDAALKLNPFTTSSNANSPSYLPHGAGSPLKNQSNDYFGAPAQSGSPTKPSSPTRGDGKENHPPSGRNTAAFERQKIYSPNYSSDSAPRRNTQAQQTLLSAADREKLIKPGVKRMANLTQLCKENSMKATVVIWLTLMPNL